MSVLPRARRRRSTTVATGLLAATLLATPLSIAGGGADAVAPAAPAAPALATTDLLHVRMAAPTRPLRPGADFAVSGRALGIADALGGSLAGALADAVPVPATFTLAVVDAAGRERGRQRVTTDDAGRFRTVVPGAVTAALAGGDDARLAVRALDARSLGDVVGGLAGLDSYAAARAGATAVTVRATRPRLRLVNSFVSSVGWVKPGERYPSRLLVTNPTRRPVRGATVTLTVPRGTSVRKAEGSGRVRAAGSGLVWTLPALRPGRTATLVLTSRAATTKDEPTIVWRDLSSRAVLRAGRVRATSTSHGPKVIPPAPRFDTARYGDRPFPVVPVQYLDRTWTAGHAGEDLDRVINSPRKTGSTFNLYQEMSLGQLFPDGDVPSSGIASADFDYAPGFPFTGIDPTTLTTCTGVTVADSPVPATGTPLYPERITDGVYNLPGTTAWYGSDANGSALIGALAGVAALQQIDSGCGVTGKLVADAAALADPEIDYSDFDTDKDGVVDFFMVVYAGCGGNGASQLGRCSDAASDTLPYDNIWPHSSSLESSYTDPATGLPGFVTHDQLTDLQGRPLFWTDATYQRMTTRPTSRKVFVRVGPYNVNPETAIDKASVISHEYGHSLGLPDFYSTGSRETYGDWTLMATDKSQNMDAYARQELGWVVPRVLPRGTTTLRGMTDSKQDIGAITWRTPTGQPYTLRRGRDGIVHNSLMLVAKLPGRSLLEPSAFASGVGASRRHAWFSGAGNDFGCATDNAGHNLDLVVPGLKRLPKGTRVQLSLKSLFDIEWDYDYGFVLTSTDGGQTYRSQPSERGVPTTSTTNPNQNSCQGTYSNGITGSSASYGSQLSVTTDRTLGNTPKATFLADTFDISELAGAANPVLRFSYSTDPGLARPGWFIDDVRITATTPGGRKVLFSSDFERSGGYDDSRIFNGGCRNDGPGVCTPGWQYVAAGAEADFDHAYYLELRDRSGFDLDGNGEIDRDPIGFQPGLYLAYTDEAHGYGNAGTDDPPAQTPIDSRPTPGSATPNLDDATFTLAAGRRSFSDFVRPGAPGHTDNYVDPASTGTDPRYPGVADPWRFTYGCLAFRVLSMAGQGLGPQRADGNLTAAVRFRLGAGCGRFDAGYTVPPGTASGG
ncbi:immune inhibitor A domain-containing protein [Nocardioides sp.]|uniref:immune inhibitor A domain-containing protein n=1 Tax=Nocardioides sp. TaxID=35761 RepID=UPI003519B8F3